MKRSNASGPRAAFDPPSDFVPEGGNGGGRRKKIWMGLGIGCGVLLLLLGGLLVAGGFKALSCCDQFGDAIKRSTAAQEFGANFAAEVSGGELDQAYARTSESFQERISREAFAEAVASHGTVLRESAPRVYDVRTRGEQGLETSEWSIAFQFAEPGAEQMLLMYVHVLAVGGATGETGEGSDEAEGTGFVVDDLSFERKARQLEAEAPAKEVLDLHGLLLRGNIDAAYGRLSPQFHEQSDVDVFRSFVEGQGDLFTNSKMTIRQVDYPAPDRASVVAHLDSASGRNAIVQYELVAPVPNMPSYQIVAISPTLSADAPDLLEDPEDRPATGGEGAAAEEAAEEAAGGEGADEDSAARPPEIQVEVEVEGDLEPADPGSP